MPLMFEWNERKAWLNFKRHRVSFPEATTVFSDPFAVTISDPDHSATEMRFIDMCMSFRGRLIVVSYTERGDRIRVISARLPTPHELSQYEEAE